MINLILITAGCLILIAYTLRQLWIWDRLEPRQVELDQDWQQFIKAMKGDTRESGRLDGRRDKRKQE